MARKSSFLLLLLLPLTGFASQEWWNDSWHYRLPVNVSSGSYSRQDMPVEIVVNFTDLLDQLGDSYGFDENSVRIVENGVEIPSQYDDAGDGYGVVVWVVNGSTSSNTNRSYYIYFDTDLNPKSAPAYPSSWGSIDAGSNSIENSRLKIALGSTGEYTGITDFIIKSEAGQDQANQVVAANSRVEGLYVNGDNTYSDLSWSSSVVENGAVRKVLRATGTQSPFTVYEEVTLYYLSSFIRVNYSSPMASYYRILGLGTPGGDVSSEADDSTTNGTSNNHYYRGVYDDGDSNGYGVVVSDSYANNDWIVYEGLNRYGWNFTTSSSSLVSYYFLITNGSSDVASWGLSLSNPMTVFQLVPESRITCSSDLDCNDSNPCTDDVCTDPGSEISNCTHSETAYCVSDDGLCCSLCNKNLDNDCSSECGNGVCEAPGENTYTCPADCTAVCGNDVCESSENQCICPSDCGVCGGSCGSCLSFQCVLYSCSCAVTPDCCPNNVCEPPGENSTSCPDDCLGLQLIVLKPANNSRFSVNEDLLVEILVRKDNVPVNGSSVVFTPGFSTVPYSLSENSSGAYHVGNVSVPVGFIGSYPLLILAENNGSVGRKYLEFNVSKSLIINLSLNKSLYDVGENVVVNGRVTTLQGRPRKGLPVYFILENPYSSWRVVGEGLSDDSGYFAWIYETTFADPPGSWSVLASSQDLAGNNGSSGSVINVSLPSKFSYFDVRINSPLRGTTFVRGSRVLISVELLRSGELVSGADVTAITSDGVRIPLKETQSGVYEEYYDLPGSAVLGDSSLMIEARKELSGALKGGGGLTSVGVLPLSVNVKVISPVQTTFEQGGIVSFVVAVTYPDGSGVKFANATLKTLEGELVNLLETSGNTYELSYKIPSGDLGTWGVLITVVDSEGNHGSALLTLLIRKAGFRFDPLLLIPLAVLVFVFYKIGGNRVLNKYLLNKWLGRERHLKSMLDATQKKYFERNIDEETYMNLMRKYEGDLVGVQSRVTDLSDKLGIKGKSKKRKKSK